MYVMLSRTSACKQPQARCPYDSPEHIHFWRSEKLTQGIILYFLRGTVRNRWETCAKARIQPAGLAFANSAKTQFYTHLLPALHSSEEYLFCLAPKRFFSRTKVKRHALCSCWCQR